MAKGMYAVIDGSTRKIKKQYAVIDGSTRKIKKMYAVVDGYTKLIFSGDGGAAYVGVAYINVNSHTSFGSDYKHMEHRIWDGSTSSFGAATSTTFSTIASKWSRHAISKNGLVCAEVYVNYDYPCMSVKIWDESTKTYVNATFPQTNDINVIMNGTTKYKSVYFDKPYISNNGTQMLIPINSVMGCSNSPYKDLFVTQYTGTCQYMLFFDIDIENKTVTFTKGVNTTTNTSSDKMLTTYWVYPPSETYGYSGPTEDTTIFSDNDENLVYVCAVNKSNIGNTYDFTYVYGINLENKTITCISSSINYQRPIGLSNDGHYLHTYYSYDDSSSYKAYYINNNTITTLSTGFTNKPYYNIMGIANMLIPDDKPGIMYAGSMYYNIDTYSVNGATITYLGEYNTYKSDYNGYIYGILDSTDNKILTHSTLYSSSGGNGASIAVAETTSNSNKVITAYSIKNFLSNYFISSYGSSNYYSYQTSRFIGKEDIVDAYVPPKHTFTNSTTWTVPTGVTSIDIFCVGGGGGAGGSSYHRVTNGTASDGQTLFECDYSYGSSGGGGYTTTALNVSVTPGSVLTITIGAGGAGGVGYYKWDSSTNGKSTSQITNGSAGGTTSVTNSSGTVLCTAAGGKGGNATVFKGSSSSLGSCTDGVAGGSGSGGTSPYTWGYDETNGSVNFGGSNGKDGTDGNSGARASCYWGSTQSNGNGGAGQGTTTRAFGSKVGTLYSSAGGNTSATSNTGTGNGGARGTLDASRTNQYPGDCGCVLIRY